MHGRYTVKIRLLWKTRLFCDRIVGKIHNRDKLKSWIKRMHYTCIVYLFIIIYTFFLQLDLVTHNTIVQIPVRDERLREIGKKKRLSLTRLRNPNNITIHSSENTQADNVTPPSTFASMVLLGYIGTYGRYRCRRRCIIQFYHCFHYCSMIHVGL